MRRRQVIVGLATAGFLGGCLGESGESVSTDAVDAYNSAFTLYDDARESRDGATDAYESRAWSTAETRFNLARSSYRQAAGRFNEAATEGAGCASLVGRAEDMFGRCVQLEQACSAWMQASAARGRGADGRAGELWRQGVAHAEDAKAYPTREPVEPEGFDCDRSG